MHMNIVLNASNIVLNKKLYGTVLSSENIYFVFFIRIGFNKMIKFVIQ